MYELTFVNVDGVIVRQEGIVIGVQSQLNHPRLLLVFSFSSIFFFFSHFSVPFHFFLYSFSSGKAPLRFISNHVGSVKGSFIFSASAPSRVRHFTFSDLKITFYFFDD